MALYSLLQQYLIENGSLPLSSSAQLVVEYTPAQLHEEDKLLIAPVCEITYSAAAPLDTEIQQLVSFVSSRLNITKQEAKEVVEKEMASPTLINDNNTVNWTESGLFQQTDGNVHFTRNSLLLNYLPILSVEKIWRQPVSETIIPSDLVLTNSTMEEEVIVDAEKDYWWVWAIAILVLSILLVLFRFN